MTDDAPSQQGCHFCGDGWLDGAEVVIRDDHCVFAAGGSEPRRKARLEPGVLPGSGAIVPIAHRTSPFELSVEEWSSTRTLLRRARIALHEWLAPDGYLLGWNDGDGLHAHLHVIPRFDDEPLHDRWLRSAINVAANRRPDPWAPGGGRAIHR